MCGDSTSIDAVDKLMPETANMIFTDPPYLMDFTGGIHADGSKSFNAKHSSCQVLYTKTQFNLTLNTLGSFAITLLSL
jgi:DNA modification methylase